MKIGVITHWWCFENYGQILQGYAFQKFLEQRGHYGFIIKYFPGSDFADKITWRRVIRRMLSFKMLIGSIKAILRGARRAQSMRREKIGRLRDFDGFRASRMNFTTRIYRSYAELKKSEEVDADIYSAGSDVVWMMLPFNDDGRVLFLDFGRADAKRISYSASFGASDVSVEYVNFATPLISRMDAVSVREPTGVNICKRMGREDAVCVMDPVFLLGADYYRKEFNVPKVRNGIYGYFLKMKPKVPLSEMDEIAKIRNQAETKIVTVYNDMGLPSDRILNPTLPDWIRMIGSANLFVTNSFHGASMAIILHTPFVVLLKNNGTGMDNRLLGLLGRLGLEDRIYSENLNTIASIANQEIDWDEVDRKLSREMETSLMFLKEKCGL